MVEPSQLLKNLGVTGIIHHNTLVGIFGSRMLKKTVRIMPDIEWRREGVNLRPSVVRIRVRSGTKCRHEPVDLEGCEEFDQNIVESRRIFLVVYI